MKVNFALGVEFWRRALPYAWSVARGRLRGRCAYWKTMSYKLRIAKRCEVEGRVCVSC